MPKLLVVLLIAGLGVEFTVGGFYRVVFMRGAHVALAHNVSHYVHGLAREIGAPPDSAKAAGLASAYGLRIGYHGPSGSWVTGALPDPEFAGAWSRLRKAVSHPQPHDGLLTLDGADAATLGWSQGRLLALVPADGGEFQFATDFRQMSEYHEVYLGCLICAVSLILIAAFMVIRRMLSPLKGLSAAVERMGRGELGHQVPACGFDELGDLGRSFNTMSSRLAALVKSREQLLLDVSHELRSPLTRIKVALEMAPEGMAKESIGDDIAEMESMVAEILEAARLNSANGKLNLEDVDVRELAADAVRDAQGRTPGARLVTGAGGGLGGATLEKPESSEKPQGAAKLYVRADRARLRKVLANVMDNALKFSSDSDSPVEVSIVETPAEIVLCFRDHGQGIPEAEIPRLFEPFYRVDRSRSRDTGGYGLGLSLCKRIMEAHGGSIRISGQPGQGTEVFLSLPKTLY